MTIAANNDVENSELATQLDTSVNTPAETAVVWHSGNMPSFGNVAALSSNTLTAPTAPGPGNVTGAALASLIATTARNATRIRRAHFFKSSSGSDPTHFGCSFGDSGTQVSALSSSYLTTLTETQQSYVETNFDITSNEDIDASDIIDAINDMASALSSHRSAAAVQLGSCHCSCHNNCHASRSRR